MKVLLIAPLPPPVGGVASVTENMVTYLTGHSEGIELSILNTSHGIRSMTSVSLLMRVYTGILNSLKTYFSVLKTIRKEMPDIIHLASSASLALIKDNLIVKAANHSGIPVAAHWHFGRIPALKLSRNWEWRLLMNVIHKSTVSVVIDNKSFGALSEEGIENIVFVPNPLALDVEQRTRESSRRRDQRKQGRIIFVGHIIRNKGVFELVEACSQIPDVLELILIGPYEEEIKRELAELAYKRDQGKWLEFTGQLNKDRVLDHMRESPVLVLPSYTEGFPMVLLEAMAMGCALIATDVGAIPEMMAISGDKPCGICIPPQNTEKLNKAIAALLGDSHMCDIMGERGRESVLKNYTLSKVIKQYRSIWERAIHGRFDYVKT